ncbi:MAG: hypothetical protein C0445_06825 [Polaromonas sp.]|jgi:uncharacterized membrane protein|nr:hypothetical protein [Polaromonas sp.]
MNDELDKLKALNTVGVISYVLHLIVAVAGVVPGAQMGVTLLLVALVIDLIKRPDAAGTWHESHFDWRLRTLLIAGVLYLVTVPLWLLFLLPGMVAWWLISFWFLYRIIKGMVRMNAGQVMEH